MTANLILEMQQELNNVLTTCVSSVFSNSSRSFREIFIYQLGLSTENNSLKTAGKRIRPLLVLLTTQIEGGKWLDALPAAAAVELIHNFSLIHDDVQDDSVIRRNRETVWVKWGKPQAINAGDAMFATAFLEMSDLRHSFSSETVLHAMMMLQETCFQLTNGQFLDIAAEDTDHLNLTDYWEMIKGKTGALISASLGLGALLAGKPEDVVFKYKDLGFKIGQAFQIQDDWLGIWGDDKYTGKSIASDLISRKKTYPILKGLELVPEFREIWIKSGKLTAVDAALMAGLLKSSGIENLTKESYQKIYTEVMNEFETLFRGKQNAEPFLELIKNLFNRKY